MKKIIFHLGYRTEPNRMEPHNPLFVLILYCSCRRHLICVFCVFCVFCLCVFFCAANKGIEADIFVVDEASRVPGDIISEVIAPMLRVKNTVLIMLSTNLGKENHYSKLFDKAKGEFEPLFLKKQVDLMCANCKAAKKDPSECNHNEHRNPSWLSGASKKRAKFFMQSQAMYAREVLGVVTSDEDGVFDKDDLEYVFSQPRVDVKFDPTYLIVSYVDIGAGVSETGIVSVIRDPDGHVILVGVGSRNTLNEKDVNTFVVSYFRQFAMHSVYSKIPHVLCVESNFGGSVLASWIQNRAISALPNIQIYSPRADREGVVLFARNKQEAVLDCICLLDEKKISIAMKVLSDNPKKVEESLQLLKKQLGNFRKVLEGSKMTFTGKMPGKSQDSQDDTGVCFLMSIKHSSDIIIVARLNEEERLQLEDVQRHLDYDEVEMVPTLLSNRRRGALNRESEQWQPSY